MKRARHASITTVNARRGTSPGYVPTCERARMVGAALFDREPDVSALQNGS